MGVWTVASLGEALAAGKHALLEKPFVVTLKEAASLNALAASKGLVVCVAQNYRFWPAVKVARELLADGVIGDPLNARVLFRRDHGAYGPSVAAPQGGLRVRFSIRSQCITSTSSAHCWERSWR